MGMKINEIPNDWKTVKLKDVLLVIRNGLITKQNKEGRGYPITRIETISDEKIDDSKVGYVSDISEEDKIEYRLIEGDILFSHINSLEHIGKTAIYDGRPEFLLHGMNLLLLRPDKSKINPLFLLYLLRFFRMKKIFWNISKKAVNQASINQTELGNLKIPIPPIQEQRIIAQILFTVDKAIQKTDEIITRTERLKKGLMKELLTGRIRVEEKDGKIVFRKETEFKEDTEIGKIPKDWEVVKLGNEKITEDIFYGITAKAVDKNTGLRILRTTDIKNYSVDWDSLPFCEITEKRSDIGKYLLKNGDLIVARSGTVGVSVLVEKDFDNIVFGSYLIKIKLKPDVSPKFIHYFFQSSAYWNQIKKAQGSTLKNLNIPLLSSLQIFIPPTIEQQKIVEILSTIDKKLELERKRKEKLERIKKGLMDLLLTGKIRITQLYNKNQQQIQETSFKYFNDK